MNLTICDATGCQLVAHRRICMTNLCEFHWDLLFRYRPPDLWAWLRGLKDAV